VRDDDTSAYDQSDRERFFLLGSRHAQTIRLNDVVVDAVVAAQTGRSNKAHQLLVFCRQYAFEIGVVVEVVEAFDQEIIGLVYVLVEARAHIQEAARDFTLVGDLLFREEIRWFSAFGVHGRKVSRIVAHTTNAEGNMFVAY